MSARNWWLIELRLMGACAEGLSRVGMAETFEEALQASTADDRKWLLAELFPDVYYYRYRVRVIMPQMGLGSYADELEEAAVRQFLRGNAQSALLRRREARLAARQKREQRRRRSR